jgi:hypothetical protein
MPTPIKAVQKLRIVPILLILYSNLLVLSGSLYLIDTLVSCIKGTWHTAHLHRPVAAPLSAGQSLDSTSHDRTSLDPRSKGLRLGRFFPDLNPFTLIGSTLGKTTR